MTASFVCVCAEEPRPSKRQIAAVIFIRVSILVCRPSTRQRVRKSRDMRFTLLALTLASVNAASIDQYLNAPFSFALTAAPSGGKVAWLMKERGANNLWVAGAPDFKGRRLT